MVRVKVRISHVALSGEHKVFKKGEEFECSEEIASGLGDDVIILTGSEPLEPEQPPGRKRK